MIQFIISATFSQSAIACYLLWKKLRKNAPEQYLMLWLIITCISFLIKIILTHFVSKDSFLHLFSVPLSLANGALLYLYVMEKSHNLIFELKEQLTHLSLLFFGLLFYAFCSISYHLTGEEYFVNTYQISIAITTIVSNTIYLGYILYLNYSDPKKYEAISWLKFPIIILLIPFLLSFNFLLGIEKVNFFIRVHGYCSGFVFVILIVQKYLLQSDSQEIINEIKPSKYKNSGLKTEQARNYVNQLEELMKKEKLYLNQELSLNDLAEKLDQPKHHLSEALNTVLEKNFYQYTNAYRVEEAQKQLKNGFNENILQLAYSSGFSSKTTFNTHFKKITGMTPVQYKKSLA
ncbi:helix-turn-helix domain-containing protein [Aureibacter tunicatorum]|uniref:AraC-like DNA-binding protein n=1 Tax=Aureibacter tunicatorum TaxID=866807 RepID=A0AAE4BRV8_9BACT|nr:AraC family transcriptional regulator [Aureibacter tunicatorum]MDR6238255.1 AraC-like DNA-binding protein [Aureibacter tunicatorum]BDD03288.1 transcriptional regulator [Aureibacter tunicatorum]